ncbi:MAG TPA: hypothetical protein VM008_15890 [Phycisphaerae bacterium]|nr:hypothetical protein [Phycisphaerae bacterium]
MITSPLMAEIYRVKDELGERFKTVRDLAEAVRKLEISDPLPPPGRTRKLIEGFPRGQSIADEGELMREIYDAKEKASLECLKQNKRLAPRCKRTPSKPKLKVRFRSPKSESKHPR